MHRLGLPAESEADHPVIIVIEHHPERISPSVKQPDNWTAPARFINQPAFLPVLAGFDNKETKMTLL